MRLRPIERWIAVVRLVAVPFAIFEVAVSRNYPAGVETWAWVTTAALAVGAAVLFVLTSRPLGDRALYTVSLAAQVFDTAILSAYVLTYYFEVGTPTRQVLYVGVVVACVRFAMAGGIVTALATAAPLAVFEELRSDHFRTSYRWDYLTLQVGLELIVALIVGWLVGRLIAESASARSRAEEAETLRDQLGRRADLLDSVNRCARALGSSLELSEAFGAFIRELRGLLPFDRMAIVLAEGDSARVMATAGTGADDVFPPGTLAPLEGSLLADVMAAGQPVYRRELDGRTYREEAQFVALGLGSRVAAPLVAGTRTIGMISVVRRGRKAFEPGEIELLSVLGRLVASAAQNIHAYEAERRTVEELRRLSTLRADFVSLVSHELRSPMAAVIGSARTLQRRWRELSSEHRDSFLALIADETSRLAALVGDVLDTSRIDSGTFPYSFTDVDLGPIVHEAVAMLAAGQDAVELVAHVPRALPSVRGDASRLRQVLANLLDNAVKYSEDGGRVDVRASVANGSVIVDVTDSGEGIAPENQTIIFEKFGRADGHGSKPGTGLGLYIARSIVEAHGGTLRVSSAPGRGSTFTLTLPASGA